ncbi:Gfo/Idh/MocA family oxidoreductase [Subtercola frigoramans]
MGRNWIATLTASPEVELVGLVDLNVELARAVAGELGLSSVTIGTNLVEVARERGANAIVNVTIPAAHHAVNTQALFAGLPVLCEKPIAPTVAEALSLAAAAEVTGQLLMTSQSRRYYPSIARYKRAIGSLGSVEIARTEFFRSARFGGFREEMPSPLLVDMAIHAFDAARYLFGTNPVSVYCQESNPSWSWYRGDAAATALFEFDGGLRYHYTGSWVSAGLETSWNGQWRVNGAGGTATWDGDEKIEVEYLEGYAEPSSSSLINEAHSAAGDKPIEIAGALDEFIAALRTGQTPSGDVRSNILSLAMVEAAVHSAEAKQRVEIHAILENAYRAAIRHERRPEVGAALEAWGSGSAGLGL